MQRSFDFAVLGDSHPEGLYVAAGLARRSYKVCLVPSAALGELPPLEPLPLRLPEKIGESRLDDLLFKVGFFKLEEALLEPVEDLSQVLLKKHRLQFDGKDSVWLQELIREFPQYEREWLKIKEGFQGAAKSLNAAIQASLNIEKANPEYARLVELEGGDSRPFQRSFDRERTRHWLEKQKRGRVYRPQNRPGESYSKFLLEHCRRWGVQILEDPVQVEGRWRHFQLNAQCKATHLIVNSLGAAKSLEMKSRVGTKKSIPLLGWLGFGRTRDFQTDRVSHWMYFDRILTQPDKLPEPLGEWSRLALDDQFSEPVVLHVQRDRLRDRATLTLGVWLPFNESRQWEERIEAGRASLRKLLPFVPDTSFKALPSAFELNEMKGECVRRGELDRLCFESTGRERKGLWSKSARRPSSLANRILVSAPFMYSGWSRAESLEECLKTVEYFEKSAQKKWAPKAQNV